MDKEAGFTLAEMMAALLILSAMAVSIAAITGNIIQSWDRTDVRLAQTRDLARLRELIEADEQGLKTNGAAGPANALLITDDGEQLLLSEAKIDKDASCVFDLVGRRCR